MIRASIGLAIVSLSFGCAPAPPSAPISSEARFVVTPVTEKRVTSLPEGELFWFVERFGDRAAAERGAGATTLVAGNRDGGWRFTLTPRKGFVEAGKLVETIGPVPVIAASRYLLRINRAGGLPGVRTEVHSHPGSEAFVVLAGRLCQRMDEGTACVDAGETRNGHGADRAMQLWSAGALPLDQFVLFVVDADRPFSSPARFR